MTLLSQLSQLPVLLHDTHSCCRAHHDLRQTCAAHAVALHRPARRSTWRLPSTRYASPARLRRMACRWHSETTGHPTLDWREASRALVGERLRKLVRTFSRDRLTFSLSKFGLWHSPHGGECHRHKSLSENVRRSRATVHTSLRDARASEASTLLHELSDLGMKLAWGLAMRRPAVCVWAARPRRN